jgi:hypothetical protein
MDDHHFNYIKKLAKIKRGINEYAITWANNYGWPIKAVIFLFIGSYAYLQFQTQFHLVKKAVFHPKY